MILSSDALEQIQTEIAKYPHGRAQAAVMAALRIAQDESGWVSDEVMNAIAGLLDIESIKVAEVATFYTMYDLEPPGRHKINVCTNISCALRGSASIVDHLTEKLGIGLGETTPDGRYTLKEVECLAACGGAPAALINRDYCENLTPQRIDEILEALE
ncbi:MAG: NADH-quinone oxidoreductase subunit NuoE [Acidiferrobacterales bacterium]|nr:NADH-quinone oxidoreductase subunit NuoE [Acidiferrobacterales bacterium]